MYANGTITVTYGDVDGVAGIDVNDAMAIVNHVIGLKELQGDALTAADVDSVAGVDVNDAMAVVNYVIGLRESLG